MSAAATDPTLKKAELEVEMKKGRDTADALFKSIDSIHWENGILFEFDPNSTMAFTLGFSNKMTDLKVKGLLTDPNKSPLFFAGQIQSFRISSTHYLIRINADGSYNILSKTLTNMMEYMKTKQKPNPSTLNTTVVATAAPSGNSGLQAQFENHKKTETDKTTAPATAATATSTGNPGNPNTTATADTSKSATAAPQHK